MSDPADSTVKPNVAKQKRRFAPTVKPRGRGRPSADTNEAMPDSSNESASGPAPTPSTSTGNKPIGHMRPEASDGRLPSVHDSQRTRGGAIKMKFKPTVPTRRNKKEPNTSSAVDDALKAQESQRSDGKFGDQRGRGRGERGRGRGRGGGRGRGVITEDITATGIFSLGPSASRARQNFGSGGSGAMYAGDTALPEATNDETTDMSIIFNNNTEGNMPVVLEHVPRLAGDLDPSDISRPPQKVPWNVQQTQPSETSPSASDEHLRQDEDPVQVKLESLSEEAGMSNTDMEVDGEEKDTVFTESTQAPIESKRQPESTSTWLMNEDAPAQNIFELDEANRLISVADDELLFFQLPSVLPKFEQPPTKKEGEDENMVKPEKEENSINDEAHAAAKTPLEDAMAALELEDIPDGQVGKLIVYKSGKIKMKIGEAMLEVSQGTRSSFLENVMVVDTDSETTKKAIELGHIVQKFVCMPDMDELLKGETN